MSVVAVDTQTGSLTIDGAKVFPIALAQPPPVGGKTPTNTDAWNEIANAGVNFVRTAAVPWSSAQIDAQIAAEKQVLDAAAAHGLHAWLQLGGVANLADAANQQ